MIREYMFSCRIKLDTENALDSDQCEKMAKEIADVIYQNFEYIENVKKNILKPE